MIYFEFERVKKGAEKPGISDLVYLPYAHTAEDRLEYRVVLIPTRFHLFHRCLMTITC